MYNNEANVAACTQSEEASQWVRIIYYIIYHFLLEFFQNIHVVIVLHFFIKYNSSQVLFIIFIEYVMQLVQELLMIYSSWLYLVLDTYSLFLL